MMPPFGACGASARAIGSGFRSGRIIRSPRNRGTDRGFPPTEAIAGLRRESRWISVLTQASRPGSFMVMFLFERGFLRFCALLAMLLCLGVFSVGLADVCHSECADDAVACSCACHNTIILCAHSSLILSKCVAEVTAGEPCIQIGLILSDIFRPPIA